MQNEIIEVQPLPIGTIVFFHTKWSVNPEFKKIVKITKDSVFYQPCTRGGVEQDGSKVQRKKIDQYTWIALKNSIQKMGAGAQPAIEIAKSIEPTAIPQPQQSVAQIKHNEAASEKIAKIKASVAADIAALERAIKAVQAAADAEISALEKHL